MKRSAKPQLLVVSRWLGMPTETWIYRHITGLQRFRPVVAVEAHLNPDWYPCEEVEWLIPATHWRRRLAKMKLAWDCGCWPNREDLKRNNLARVLVRRRPALLHAHFLWNGFVLDPARRAGVPVLFTAHGSDVTQAAADPGYRQRLEAVFSGAARIIAVSEFIATRLIRLGCPRDKLQILPLGVPIPQSRPRAKPRDGRVHFLSVGALRPIKGHPLLVRAFASALRRSPAMRLTIVGEGEQRGVLEAEIRTLRLVGKVILTGALPEERVSWLYDDAHVYVQHSMSLNNPAAPHMPIEEGLGISYLEAASHGLPVIGTNTGGIPEVCHDGSNGLLVAPGDEEALADAMLGLADDPALRKTMGMRGRELAQDRFDQTRQLERLEAVYDETVRLHGGGGRS